MRAIVVRRPLTEAEINDPTLIPADALSNLADTPLDLENVSEEALNAWVAGYIDGAARYDESSGASENSGASKPDEGEDARAKGESGRGQRRKRTREMSRG